jgi:predicted DsbA family dithiol-disulfide isomerase
MAQISPRITADVIEANEFPQLSQRYRVMSVPKIVVNGTHEFVGAQPEERFLAAIRQAIGKSTSKELEK